MNNQIHTPVLFNELISNLNINSNGTYVDCTAGYGGHSQGILNKLKNGKLICIDQDVTSINYLKKLFAKHENVKIIKANFEQIINVINEKVDGIIFDVGVSSIMFDDPKRGFSYKIDGPLDMRMNNDSTLTAKQVINSYTRAQLIDMFKKYGETDYTERVVSNIIHYRENKQIESTLELADIISNTIKGPINRKHPAKKYFQAIRIEVNNELTVLQIALRHASKIIKSHGRIAVITFHSLEDRIVKNFFKDLTTPKDEYSNKCPITKIIKPEFKLITKKAILPTLDEIKQNRRSHSAKLRVIEKI